jgi:hypothetical protein
MSRKLKIAIISVLMFGTASAAMAESGHTGSYYACHTDEGQGRQGPCDGGNV